MAGAIDPRKCTVGEGEQGTTAAAVSKCPPPSRAFPRRGKRKNQAADQRPAALILAPDLERIEDLGFVMGRGRSDGPGMAAGAPVSSSSPGSSARSGLLLFLLLSEAERCSCIYFVMGLHPGHVLRPGHRSPRRLVRCFRVRPSRRALSSSSGRCHGAARSRSRRRPGITHPRISKVYTVTTSYLYRNIICMYNLYFSDE
jgi:hypothetical protein